MGFDFSSIHTYKWESLYVVGMEVQLGVGALRKLIVNQEGLYWRLNRS